MKKFNVKVIFTLCFLINILFPQNIYGLSPLGDNIISTAYNEWPMGFLKTPSSFSGGVLDGKGSMYLVPNGTNKLLKLNISSRSIQSFDNWPEDFSLGAYNFSNGVFDGKYIWLAPKEASNPVKINTETGEIIKISWPDGFTSYDNEGKYSDIIFDGQNIWLVPMNLKYDIIKYDINTNIGEIYNYPKSLYSKGELFKCSIFDGENIYLIPCLSKNPIIKVANNGDELSLISINNNELEFSGAVFDGDSIWFVPKKADTLLKLNLNNNDIASYSDWPKEVSKHITGEFFGGGIYDGENIYLIPEDGNCLVKVNKFTGEMNSYNGNSLPDFNNEGFCKGVYDDEGIFLIPKQSNRIVRIIKGGTLEGIVSDKNSGKKISNVKVKIDNGENYFETKTNSNGEYTFQSVFPSIYSISVDKENFSAGTVEVMESPYITKKDIDISSSSVPKIEAENKTVLKGAAFDPLDSVKAFDENDGDITQNLTYTGSVDTEKAGNYNIVYTISNANGIITNKEINIEVKENNPPFINAMNREIFLYSTFDPLNGVTAMDAEDGDITSNIKITENINTSIEGTYDVIYSVSDSDGNTENKTISVKVIGEAILLNTLNQKEMVNNNEVQVFNSENNSSLNSEQIKDHKYPIKEDEPSIKDVESLKESDEKTVEEQSKEDESKEGSKEETSNAQKENENFSNIENEKNKDSKDIAVFNRQTSKEPKIIVTGNTNIELKEEFDPLSIVLVMDENGNDITPNTNVFKNTVNTKIPGKYEVLYEVMGQNGKQFSKSVDINVVDTNKGEGNKFQYKYVIIVGILLVVVGGFKYIKG